jgi:hypothetical protein
MYACGDAAPSCACKIDILCNPRALPARSFPNLALFSVSAKAIERARVILSPPKPEGGVRPDPYLRMPQVHPSRLHNWRDDVNAASTKPGWPLLEIAWHMFHPAILPEDPILV